MIVVTSEPAGGGADFVSPLPDPSAVECVPVEVLTRWEHAYRQYGHASEAVSAAPPGDPEAARMMAETSAEVAAAWQEIAEYCTGTWWSLAAVEAAGQAFTAQASDWAARVSQIRASRSRRVRGPR
ncbi:hypothetical protein DFQ13_106390 [Actinokineospora spheciospongiae]|nr:hypothetical protein DFQ13_106390 [Actinokineospora spheciospongiae]